MMTKGRRSGHNVPVTKRPVRREKNTSKISRNALLTYWKPIVIVAVLIVIPGLIYQGYLETRVITPFDTFKLTSLIHDDHRLWGTYRANLYFGIRSRHPESPLFGLLWYFPRKLIEGNIDIKHWAEPHSNLKKFGWVKHDGKHVAVQEIIDGTFLLTNTFLRYLNDSLGVQWASKISISSLSQHSHNDNETKISFVWYATFDETALHNQYLNSDDELNIRGYRQQPDGEFVLRLRPRDGKFLHKSSIKYTISSLGDFKDLILSNLHLRMNPEDKSRDIFLSAPTDVKKPNFVAVQITCIVPCSIEIVYQDGQLYQNSEDIEPESAVGKNFLQALKTRLIKFENDFESKFGLRKKGFNSSEIKFAETTLSQLIGGVSYFYGASKVQSAHNNDPVSYWKAPLFTATPSRSFFPRGFLWDEGFHGLLISSWDLDLEMQIIAHWFDLINFEGWIPREQILGNEALAKVPEEFVVQQNTNANPPAFFLTLKFILDHYRDQLSPKSNRFEILDRLYPRLKKWFFWFNTTQIGSVSGSYRWRGRNSTTDRELNPKTLVSGLDDFPRAAYPTDDERHIDLRCWIQFAAEVMVQLSEYLQYDSDRQTFSNFVNFLSDENLLNLLHWSSKTESFADYGLHTDDLVLVSVKDRHSDNMVSKRKVTGQQPILQLVDRTFGYLNLFPFFLNQIDVTSPKLAVILNQISDRKHLWTDFGLRSLSISSPLYKKYNTATDPPYWRGNIWINMNYLAVRALYYYGHQIGPSKDLALKLYDELKSNLIQNMFRQYQKTGFVWENYDDVTGEGRGTKPFTGWSSLIVLIMADKY